MWLKRRVPINGEFPEGFSVQRIGVTAAKALADRPPAEIALYFRDHPEVAKGLLYESYDKRYTPSTFIAEDGNGIRVGWCTRNGEYECVREFANLADAATDYLLFSRGKGRWNTSGNSLLV